MNRFFLQVAIIIGAGLITGLAFSLTSPVKLRLDPDINKGITPRPPLPPTGPTGNPAPTGQPPQNQETGSTGPVTPPAVTAPTGEASSDLFISIDGAKAIFDKQQAVFIDARPLAEYLKSHIPGAMHLEKDSLNAAPPAKVLNYLPGIEVVVYCHGALCTDSENVIKRLVALNKGIGPYRIIKDGFPGWEKAGLPTASGPEVGFE